MHPAWQLAARFVFVLGLVGCYQPPARRIVWRPPADPLDEQWLYRGGDVMGADLAQLVDLAKPDPEATAVFAEATRQLGGSLEAVARRMSRCAGKRDYIGHTVNYDTSFSRWRSLRSIAFDSPEPYDASVAEALTRPAKEHRRVVEPDLVSVEVTSLPEICIDRNLTVGQAYAVVLHELVHATRLDPREGRRLAVESSDEETFARAFALSRGGEVDAFSIAVSARLRLRGGHDLGGLKALLTPDGGDVLDRAALLRVVLAPRPEGLGYRSRSLHDAYGKLLEGERVRLEERRAKYVAALENRKQAIVEGQRRATDLEAGLAAAAPDGAAAVASELAEMRLLIRVARVSQDRILAALEVIDRERAAFATHR